ncbi:Dihydrolipoyllysine-residue acetyltransferase component of acetoin cleaving system [Bacillus sp. THAF10]|uniref:alpha/beta fold hydrolase n=1 Tax=Bacillus sp. THAF10 TaxID=2587848 RepID=UPI001268ABDE|nr:alpha/beta hydrolase [Bacillus sp. THAF10]QFT89087.1 Dihydrolipoyllysine-residue acetyltransferase component of acetoin cleaving system [Bacillus sp. THAF10]
MNPLLRRAISTLFFPLTVATYIVSKKELRHLQPRGKLIKIDGRQIHAHVTGDGGPTIILEAGMGGTHLDWSFIQDGISKKNTVLSYDRAGYGWSEESARDLTVQQHVNTLRMLLQELRLKPPFVLVGHSYGGLMMREFAATYPQDVASLILIDAVHEDWYDTEQMTIARKTAIQKIQRVHKAGYYFADLGVPRLFKLHVGSKHLPKEILKETKALGFQAKSYRTIYSELSHAEKSVKELQKCPQIPEQIPITVLSAGKQTDVWKQQQQKLAALHKNTEHFTVEDSFHAIPIHKPDAVIHTINTAVNLFRDQNKGAV